jgi:hypothetical protein
MAERVESTTSPVSESESDWLPLAALPPIPRPHLLSSRTNDIDAIDCVLGTLGYKGDLDAAMPRR